MMLIRKSPMILKSNLLRNALSAGFDASIAGAAFVLALYVRWGENWQDHATAYLPEGVVLASAITLLLVLYTRLYRRYWRYVSLKDLMTILKICGVAMLSFYALMFLVTRLEMLPRSVPVLHLILLIGGMAAPRVLVRAWHEKNFRLPEMQQVPVLLIGQGDEAETFIRESMRHASFPYRVVGVVATESRAVGRNIHHVKIYGTMEEIPAVLRKLKRKGDAPQRLILAAHDLPGHAIQQLLSVADSLNISMARIPKLSDLTRGDTAGVSVRPIEVEDILGRPQATLDIQAMGDLIKDRRVLVTGAGGSIGGELVRQLSALAPAEIILLEQSEYALYQIDRELSETAPDLPRRAILADVREAEAMLHLFQDCRPEVVFHAAALKHVPLCEVNVAQAVRTNIFGTQAVADACLAAKVSLMVQISTDKAVNPTNVMGVCKRVGESYCQALGQAQNTTRFVTVRFGNVLGSTGSVVPLFQRQLERGGPLTVTHPEMTRYFMTIREAVRLVIQSAALETDQAAPIYVLDMGTPIQIDALARQMIRLAGLRPDVDVAISYTGLRPGEKMHEQLFYGNEALQPTAHEAIQVAAAREASLKELGKQLSALFKLLSRGEDATIRAALKTLVPEYVPTPAADATATTQKESA